MGQTLLGTGLAMILASMIFAPLFLIAGSGAIRKKGTGVAPLTTRTSAIGAFDASASYPVADEWDDDEAGYSSHYRGAGRQERYDDDYDDEDDRPRGLMSRRW